MERPRAGRRSTAATRRPVAIIAGALATILVLAVGAFAAKSFFSGGVDGGADSPEAAVTQFVEAIERSDPIGLLKTLEPDLSSGLVATAERLQKVATEQDLATAGHEFDAFRVHFVGVEPTITRLNDRVAAATFSSGKIQFTYDASKVPAGLEDHTVEMRSTDIDLAQVQADSPLPMALMIVKEGDRWFISPLYTLGEWLNRGQGLTSAPHSATDPVSDTAKTPQAAVNSFLSSLATGDLDAAARHLTPHELAFWTAYSGTTILGEARNRDLHLEVVPTSTTVKEIDGRHALVSVDTARYSASANGESDSGSLTGDCLVSNVNDDGACLAGVLANIGSHSGAPRGTNTSARLTIATVKVGDGWAVSLLGTAAQTLASAATSVGPQTLLHAFGLVNVIKPSGALILGGNSEIDLTTGVATLDLEVAEDTPADKITVRTNAIDLNFDLYTLTGKEISTYDSAVVLGKGHYRLVVYADHGADSAKVPITVGRS